MNDLKLLLHPVFAAKRLREEITDKFNDNYVISYPRSGRNWTRNMLLDYGIPNFKEKLFQLDTLPQEIKSENKIIFTHDIGDYPYVQNYDNKNPNRFYRASRYAGKNVFLILRNPIDTAVSHYHWLKFLQGRGQSAGPAYATIDEFVLSADFGVPKVMAVHQLWIDTLGKQGFCKKFTIYDYEDIKTDTLGYLKHMLNFFSFTCDEEKLIAAIDKNTAAKAAQDAQKQTRAGQKLATHTGEKISDETRAKLNEMLHGYALCKIAS